MSLQLMKERMRQSGTTFREEEIKDAIRIEEIENKNGASYCPTFYKVINYDDYDNMESYQKINPRLYSRKWSAYDVHTMNMKTLIKEPVEYGDTFYNQRDNTYWLCMQTDCVDDINYISKLVECNFHMYWQKNDGTIISRYVFAENASSYNNGEEGNKVIMLQSNQFMVYIPYDDEIDELDSGKRISLTKSLRRCKPYKLTRPDDLSYNYGNKGILNIIFTQTETDVISDKLIELPNGKEVWICDYKEPTSSTSPLPPSESDETTDLLNAVILGNTNLKNSFSRTYTVNFTDENGNEVDWSDVDFTWNIVSDFNVEQTVGDNTIKLSIDNEDLVGYSFLLQILIENDIAAQLTISIVESF